MGGFFFFFFKGEREIFGFIENGSWRKKRRQLRRKKEEKALCEDGVVLFEAGRLEQEGGWGRSLLAPTRGLLFSALWP